MHERSVDSDFLLLELRDILKRNKKIKVILVRCFLPSVSGQALIRSSRCRRRSTKLNSPTTTAERLASRSLGLSSLYLSCSVLTGSRRFTHPVQDHYLEEILPRLHGYQPSVKPAKKATQAQLDRMRESFISRGVENERTLMALESLTRSERIDFGSVVSLPGRGVAG